jgi:hypothetical protein
MGFCLAESYSVKSALEQIPNAAQYWQDYYLTAFQAISRTNPSEMDLFLNQKWHKCIQSTLQLGCLLLLERRIRSWIEDMTDHSASKMRDLAFSCQLTNRH